MTRGRIAIIVKDNEVLTSTEFNGDMYMPTKKWHGYGSVVINALKRVKDIADFHYEVARFNKLHHHYNDRELIYKNNSDCLDFSTDYFDKWFSDYVYIKNISDSPKTITTKNKTFELDAGEIARLYFGELERITK